MTPDDIMRDLARYDIFPKEAMTAARADREVIVPVFLDLVERLGTQDRADMQEGEITALLPVFHMLGEFKEPRAYRPLLKLLRQPSKTLDYLLGDGVAETSFRVVAGTFDGDLQHLFDFILDDAADVFARSSMMDALVLIVQLHPETRDAVADFFRHYRQNYKGENSDLLVGWVEALADLGLPDMEAQICATFQAGLIPKEYCGLHEVLGDLNAAVAADGKPANPRYRIGLISDAIEELSKWHGYSDAYLDRQKRLGARTVSRAMPWAETFMHDTPPIGRNELCPCGSGKKFKKCCLQ